MAETPRRTSEDIYTAYLQGSLRLSSSGEWWHNGKPFSNQKIAQLFHHNIRFDPTKSSFVIRLGKQQATFSCDDTPFFVQNIDTSLRPWQITLNDGRTIPLVATSLSLGAQGQFYCEVPVVVVSDAAHTPHAAPPLSYALFSRAAHQDLLQHAIDERSLEIAGEAVILRTRGK